MPARRLWILLLLSAVFTMHGIQYVSADPGAGRSAAATAQHDQGMSTDDSLLLGPLAAVDELQPAGASAATSVLADAPLTKNMPGHGVAAHFWSLCLAVLLAGLALLAAAMLIRWASAARALDMVRRPISRVGWFRRPRPPDLSALCLLRI